MDTLTSKQIKTHLVGLREGLRVGLRLGRGVGFEVSTSNMPDSQPVRSTVASSDDVAGFKVVGVSVTSNMPDSELPFVGVVRGVVVDELVVIPSELSKHSLSSRCQNLSRKCE